MYSGMYKVRNDILSKKYTFEEVKNIIETQSECKLLSTEYKNNKEKMLLLCKCGETFEKGFGTFVHSQKVCKSCMKKIKGEKISNTNKTPIKEIVDYINKKTELLFLGFPERYTGKKSNIKLQCSCGEPFITSVAMLVYKNKHQCNKCSLGNQAKKQRYNFDEMKNRIESNTDFKMLDYNINTGKMKLMCSCGNTIENTTLRRIDGINQCKDCSNEKLRVDRRKTVSEIIEYININTDCLFLEFPDGYKNQNSKIKLQCLCGKVFTTRLTKLYNRNKHQCNDCGDVILGEKNITDIKYIEDYINKNSNSKLIERYKVQRRKYKLTLQCHCGEFYDTSFSKFKQGYGRSCPICSKSISIGELEVKTVLENINSVFKQEHYIKYNGQGMYFDFVVYDGKTIKYAIEYDGEQHFKPVDFFGGEDGFKETKRRDKIKNEYCMEKKIPLLRIPYTEFHNIKEIVSDFHSRFFNA